MSSRLTVVIILKYIQIWNLYVVHLKLLQCYVLIMPDLKERSRNGFISVMGYLDLPLGLCVKSLIFGFWTKLFKIKLPTVVTTVKVTSFYTQNFLWVLLSTWASLLSWLSWAWLLLDTYIDTWDIARRYLNKVYHHFFLLIFKYCLNWVPEKGRHLTRFHVVTHYDTARWRPSYTWPQS